MDIREQDAMDILQLPVVSTCIHDSCVMEKQSVIQWLCPELLEIAIMSMRG